MKRILSVTMLLVTIALVGPAGAQSTNDVPESGARRVEAIAAEHLYNGVNRPMMIRIGARHAIGELSLVLVDAQHRVVSGPVAVRAGRTDLSELMPEIWQLRETVYLQLLEYDRPTGAPLVLQPMLSRMVPVTEQAARPGGEPYTRIVDWRSEMEPEPESATEPAGTTTSDQTPADSGGAVSSPMPIEDSAADVFATSDERLLSGIRAYPERDVELLTTAGRVLLMMRPDEAPNTAWNFLKLCEGGFYREVAFHRVVPLDRIGRPFVIQAGDPTATGDGGPGYWLPMERSDLPHDFGVISMARADDPDSAGSQFFICLSREGTARLDGQYCAFGMAVEGADTIRAIADTELADIAAGRPVNPPLILETALVAAPARVPGEPRVPQWMQPEEPEVKPDKPRRVPR